MSMIGVSGGDVMGDSRWWSGASSSAFIFVRCFGPAKS